MALTSSTTHIQHNTLGHTAICGLNSQHSAKPRRVAKSAMTQQSVLTLAVTPCVPQEGAPRNGKRVPLPALSVRHGQTL
eukprot:1161024-Pelagomonas_calceolata.AAC.6